MASMEKRFRREGLTFCTLTLERQETGIERADRLYARFCEAALRHAEGIAREAMERYDGEEDPRKKFRLRPLVCRCTVRTESGQDRITVTGEYRADGQVIRSFTHVWDPVLCLLLPPGREEKKTGKIRHAGTGKGKHRRDG